MINSRSINDLDAEIREVCNLHLRLCRDSGIELIVTSTWRDYAQQDVLYKIGRDGDTRRVVTNAKAGQSWHNFKCAWDVVPVILGKPVWDAKDPIWQRVIQYGKEAGAEAGAEWTSFPDLPHFQVRPLDRTTRITIEEAKSRYDLAGTIFKA